MHFISHLKCLNPSQLLSLNVAQLCERLCFVYKCNLLHHPLTHIKMKTSYPYASLPLCFLNQSIVAKEIVALTMTGAHPPTSTSILATLGKIQNTTFIFFIHFFSLYTLNNNIIIYPSLCHSGKKESSQSPCVIPHCYHQEASVRTSKHNIHYMVKSIWATPPNLHFRCFQSHWCMKSITEPRRLPLQTFVNEWFKWAPWISGWCCNRTPPQQQVSSWNFFPSRYSRISCKWDYWKVEVFRKHSSSAMKRQIVKLQSISTETVHRELHGLGFHCWAAPVGVMCRWPGTFRSKIWHAFDGIDF